MFRMTAKQILNHVLPALAGIKPNLTIKVEHRDAFKMAGASSNGLSFRPFDALMASGGPSPRHVEREPKVPYAVARPALAGCSYFDKLAEYNQLLAGYHQLFLAS